jgi:adenylosuccinate lyase
LLRSYAAASLENVALWHERDISHSSVERVIAPDATTALHFALLRAERLVRGLVVDPAAMKKNLDAAGDIVASGGVLLALVEKGVMRQEAYGWVQRCAMSNEPLREALKKDADVKQHLDAKEIDRLCALETHLQHVDTIFARVLGS